MLNYLAVQAPAAASAVSADGPSFMNSAGIQAIFIFVGCLLLMLVGIKMFAKSDRGDVNGAAKSGVVVLIGAIIFSAGAAGSWYALGTGAFSSLFNG